MAALSSSIPMPKSPQTQFLSGSSLKHMDQCFLKISSNRKAKLTTRNMPLIVRASGDGGRPYSGMHFVGGFVLGGLIVGALGCVYAPQITKAIAGADKKDLMRKLPKFMYDEEKALERTRKVLAEKISQLNSAIDDVSAQLRSDEAPNGSACSSEEVEATI